MKRELPEIKQTTLGLYVTSREAYDMWKAAPDRIKILDVRSPEEFLFVGHADMAWNFPAFLQTYQWDASAGHFAIKPNPDFLSKVSRGGPVSGAYGPRKIGRRRSRVGHSVLRRSLRSR